MSSAPVSVHEPIQAAVHRLVDGWSRSSMAVRAMAVACAQQSRVPVKRVARLILRKLGFARSPSCSMIPRYVVRVFARP